MRAPTATTAGALAAGCAALAVLGLVARAPLLAATAGAAAAAYAGVALAQLRRRDPRGAREAVLVLGGAAVAALVVAAAVAWVLAHASVD